MDLSGKIRAFVAGPFAFQDYSMECRFQRHFIDSIFDRTRRIMCVWLPFVGIMRIVWLAYWIVFPFDISTVDLIIFAIRFLFLILGSTMFMRNWADANKRRIGLANLWIARTYLVVAALGESDVHKRDPQKLASLVAYLCICGLFIPSFAEYLVCAVPLSFTRPLIMSLVSGAGKDQAQEIIFQHGLILALGISITWTAHADCRRDWLRSAATTSKCLGLRKAPPIMAGATSRGECRSGWGLFGDDYFNSSDLEEIRAESTQVELNFPDFSFGHTPCPSALHVFSSPTSAHAAGHRSHRGSSSRAARHGPALAPLQHHHRRRSCRICLPGVLPSPIPHSAPAHPCASSPLPTTRTCCSNSLQPQDSGPRPRGSL
jgi:hypothetical protein